jgi:hypothetical protein
MTNTELMADVAALDAHNLTNLFVRIADTYSAGLQVKGEATEAVTVLIEAKLARRTSSRVHLTERGWSVATRIEALAAAKAFASRKPSHWRTR